MPGEKTKGIPLNIISKYRGPLYGFSILWVVIFHAHAINGVDYTFGHPGSRTLSAIANIIYRGNLGVDVFLLLSGIFLYYSYSRNPDPIGFMKKRLVRIYVPVVAIETIWWVVRLTGMYGVAGMLPQLFARETLLSFWFSGDGSTWYVSLIMVLYLFYPYIYMIIYPLGTETTRATATKRAIILIIVVFAAVLSFWNVSPDRYATYEVALTRIPIFILGAYLGKFVKEGASLPVWSFFVALVGTIVFFWCYQNLVIEHYFSRYPYFPAGIAVTWLLAVVFWRLDEARQGKSLILRFLSFTGGFSLELYLTHIMLNQVLRVFPFYEERNLAQYAIVAVIAYLLAWAVAKWISGPVSKRLLGRK